MTVTAERTGRSARRAAAVTALPAALLALAWPALVVAAGQRHGRTAHDSSAHVRPIHAKAHPARARRARSHHPRSRQASSRYGRALHASDSATLHYVSSTVNVFYETGHVGGTLPGFMRVHMRLGARFSGRYVIEAKGGSIRGKGSAIPHGSGTYESFTGTIAVTGGTGRFAHAHGHAHVYGTFNRINNQMKIHTVGTLHY